MLISISTNQGVIVMMLYRRVQCRVAKLFVLLDAGNRPHYISVAFE